LRITLPSGTPAELVKPSSGTAAVGLVIIPDIMGLSPLFTDMVTRLAESEGWAVCAFEPFARREHLELAERLRSVGELDDARIMEDAVSAADATDCLQVGVLGFCMGGMYALKASGTGRFTAAVSFYGMIHVPEQWRSDTQGDPLSASQVDRACPVMAVVGSEDQWTPERDVAELEAGGATVVRYEGADHGFVHDPARPAHRPVDAADAWERALAFLQKAV
jgi:carboxymethylenebutenolidase